MHKASELRLERLRAGVTGRELAKAIGVSHAAIYYWERGGRKIGDKAREKIRKFLLTRSTLGK